MSKNFDSGSGCQALYPSGEIRKVWLPGPADCPLQDISLSPNGDVWYTRRPCDRIGWIANGAAGGWQVHELRLPWTGAENYDISAAADGSIWFTMLGRNSLGRVRLLEVEKAVVPKEVPVLP